MSRTNIVIDDALVERGMALTGARSKRELVDIALKELIRNEDQKGLLTLEGTISWEGDLIQLRENRMPVDLH